MIPADLEVLALADVVGALDADERRQLLDEVAALSPEDQAQIARLYDHVLDVAALAMDEAPPPELRARVLAATRAPGHYSLTAAEGAWVQTPLPGIEVKVLAVDRSRGAATLLIRGGAGAVYPSHRHSGPEDCYVLRGSIMQDGRTFHAGDFIHADADSHHGEITTIDGAEVLLVGAIADYLPELAG